MDGALGLSLLLSCVIGLVLGLFGGGGSVLAVPVLVYAARVAPETAVAMSLAIVGATSLTASYLHHLRGHVRVGIALRFGGAGILTAFLGARLTHLVPGRVLMLLFASVTLFVGGWMLLHGRWSDRAEVPQRAPPPGKHRALLVGAAVGGLKGFLGVGGGFLIVPALAAFAGLALRDAIGTSLLVIAINCGAGFLGHLGRGALDPGLVAMLTLAAVVGAVVGERVTRSTSLGLLRRGFAVLVILIGMALALATLIPANPLPAREPLSVLGLIEERFEDTRSLTSRLEDGVVEWRQAGLPIERSAS